MSATKIWLVGFMGSGKSTLGALLAEKLNWGFLDTDVAISQEVGMDIEAIFSQYGQDYFRQLEGGLITRISQHPTPLVVATGGGLPIFNSLEGLGEIIYLHVGFEVILERLEQDNNPRPLFENPAQLHALYTQRHPLYARIATHTINANQHLPQVLNQLLGLVSNIHKN
ncbi:Shikimate kinase I [Helicobacter bizzozeronii CCUG 35545]|nr:Shikimate kinase I [Helicobacter bizzozeronii CCUG 35545]